MANSIHQYNYFLFKTILELSKGYLRNDIPFVFTIRFSRDFKNMILFSFRIATLRFYRSRKLIKLWFLRFLLYFDLLNLRNYRSWWNVLK